MTRETFTPAPLYTIATAGPHPITHPYRVDTEIACTIFNGATIVQLVKGADFTVSPSSSETTGDVTLSASIFAAHTGAKLLINRVTVADQGWAGQTAREKGLEAQLDAQTQRIQEMNTDLSRAIKIPQGDAAELPLDSSNLFLGFDGNNQIFAGMPATTTLLVSPFASTLLDDLDAAAARETLGYFYTLADLLANTTLTPLNTTGGDIISAGGEQYKVVTSGAHFTNAGGVGFQHVDGAYVVVVFGQSNAQGANGGGPNPASPLVKTWDAVLGEWGGSSYTALPWTRSNPDGNSSNNNIGLSRAHYMAGKMGRPCFVIYDATGGTSIDAWVASGTASVRYAAVKAKIEAALATPELAGVTEVSELIWAQGEADYLDVFETHLDNLMLLRNQLRAETWCNWETPIYMCAPSNQHDRYAPQQAIAYMCSKVDNQCIYVPTNGLRTSYDPLGDGSVVVPGGDYTHWLGESLWEIGYSRVSEAKPFEAEPSLFHQSGSGSARPDTTMAVSTFGSLYSWESRTGGAGLNEAFSGDGTTTDFTLIYRNTQISKVTVDGVVMVEGTDYTVSGQVIAFTAAPASGASNIAVIYGVTIQAPPAFNSIGWGVACYPDGNYTYAFGYDVSTDNFSSYGLLAGNDLTTENGADFFGGFGWQNIIAASKSFVAGQGNVVADEGQAAVGLFAKYAAPEADPVLFQVGNGATTSTRSNAFAARASGVLEMENLPEYATNADATAGGLLVGQVFRTPGGALRVLV